MWLAVILGSAACYGLKLAGLCIPRRLLAGRLLGRAADLLPIALLATLVLLQTFTSGARLTVDARAAGVAAAVAAVMARAPFLVVVSVAVAVTAGVRLIH